MKKRLFSVLTCLALCLSLLPTAALAAEVGQTVYVGGVELTTTADNSVVYAKTSTDGTVTAGGSEDDYSIKWDGETLTLKGAEISGGDNGISREGSLQLVLEGTNTISGYATGIQVTGDLTVSSASGSSGSLEVFATIYAQSAVYGISVTGNLDITGGSVNVAVAKDGTEGNEYIYGISAGGGINITGGIVSVEARNVADNGNGDCYGLFAGGSITISDGRVETKTVGNDTWRFGYGIYTANGDVVVSGGELELTDEKIRGYGINAEAGSITISGGTVSAQGSSRAIYAGKEVTADPPQGMMIIVYYGSTADATQSWHYTSDKQIDYNITSSEYFRSEVTENTGGVQDPNISIGGVGLYGDADTIAYATTNGNGAVTAITGEDFDPNTGSWNIQWDGSTLTLKGATITQEPDPLSSDYIIERDDEEDLTIELMDENKITGASGIRVSQASLTIRGTGSLEIISDYWSINPTLNLTIEGGTITATTTQSNSAILCAGYFTIAPQTGDRILVKAGADADSAEEIEGSPFRSEAEISGNTSDSKYFHSSVVVPVTGVELSEDSLALIEGETGTLTATVQPADATYRTVSWQSSNETIASVQDGTVTAQAPGTATITVTAADGSFTDRCTVTVSARSYQISADPSALNFDSVEEGYTEAPAAQTVTVTNTGNQSVTVMLPTGTNYTITASTGFAGGAATLNPGSEAQFTVQPNTGLNEGVQDEALTISGSSGARAEVALYFTVTEAAHTHSYNTAAWVSDGISHWHECSCGAKSDVAAHSGGTATCQEQAKCEVCGKAYGALGAHAYGTAWVSDGSSHWHTCTVCEAIADKASHVYDNDTDTTCNVCGYVRQIDPAEFTITFNAAGGTTPASQTTAGGKLTSLPTSTRSGYTLLGWYTAASGGGLVTTDTVFTENTTLYAHWTVRSSGGGGGGGGGSSQSTGPATDRSDGWNNIQKEIGGAEAGDAVTIDMNGATEVPREVLEEVAGKSVTVEVDLGGGVSWTINGQDVPEDVRLADLDLGVRMDTSGISADVLNSVSGEYGAVQVSLDHDGEFGFALTFTAPLGRENAGHWANLYHYDEDRDRLVFETSARITSNGTVSLRFSHASQYAILIDDESHTPVELPFTDVPEDAWYGEAVRYVYEHGLMAGTGTTTFSPDMTTSRAMVATILWQQAGSPVVNYAMDYADVDPAAWYGEAVRWAASEGIAGGYGGGLFGPDDPVTREQLAAMLYQFARNQGYDLSVGQDTNILSYTDAFQVSEYAVSALQWACGAGILSGTGDGSTLSPQGEATRAQTAVMLQRFCELYQ